MELSSPALDPAGTAETMIAAAAADLRHKHAAVLAGMPRDQVIDRLDELARRWLANDLKSIESARLLGGPFGFDAVSLTLGALLESLSRDQLNRLVDEEGVRAAEGFPVIGHIVAGNTPLLAWTSMIRGLLVGSAALVKLPSADSRDRSPAPIWAEIFVEALDEVDAALASTISLLRFWGGDDVLMSRYCEAVDLAVAYGSDRALLHLRELRGGRPFVGYGHRISIGLVDRGADFEEAAAGMAVDTLLFDQGGCLSPQAVYVIGGLDEARRFASTLASAMALCRRTLPAADRTEATATTINRTRLLARMAGCSVWEDPDLQWTVIFGTDPMFEGTPTHGIISVHAIDDIECLRSALSDAGGLLQGCCVATLDERVRDDAQSILKSLGVSYLCPPGSLQAPPISWPADGLPVLRSLLPQ